MRIILRLKITGLKHVPETGPLVVVINHIAFWDPVVVIAQIPRLAIPMSKAEVFKFPVFGWIVKTGGAIPVHRDEADMAAVKMALKVLKRQGVILLAPEGTRSPTCQLQQAKDGAAMLALREKAQILPVAITGTHRLKINWKQLRRAPVNITIGEPFFLQTTSGKGRPSREEMVSLTGEIMYSLARLLPPEFRGVYGNLKDLDNERKIGI